MEKPKAAAALMQDRASERGPSARLPAGSGLLQSPLAVWGGVGESSMGTTPRCFPTELLDSSGLGKSNPKHKMGMVSQLGLCRVVLVLPVWTAVGGSGVLLLGQQDRMDIEKDKLPRLGLLFQGPS